MSKDITTTTTSTNSHDDVIDDNDQHDFFDEYDPQQPSLRLFEIQHLLTLSQTDDDEKAKLHREAMSLIKKHHLLSYYQTMYPTQQDEALVKSLQEEITKKYETFTTRLEEAQETGVDKDVLDVQLERAQFICGIGDESKLEEFVQPLVDKSMTVNDKIDLYMDMCKYALSIRNYKQYDEYIQKLLPFIEKDGDWDKRNKFQIYKGVNYLIQGDFNNANDLFVPSIPTYASTELIPFDDAISIAVLLSIIRSKRSDFKEKVVDSPEVIQTVLTRPLLGQFLDALYKCHYAQFYALLPKIHDYILTFPFLAPHASLYLKEARIVAYSQYLASFRSVTIPALAEAFNVSPTFIEHDVSNLVAAGRLHCRISLVSQVITIQRPSDKQTQYKELLQKGDKLASRVNKLTQQLKTT